MNLARLILRRISKRCGGPSIVLLALLVAVLAIAVPRPLKSQPLRDVETEETRHARTTEADQVERRVGGQTRTTEMDWAVQIQVGPSLPLSPTPFSDYYNPGLAAKMSASVAFQPNMHLGLSIGYQRHTPSDPVSLVGSLPDATVQGAEYSSYSGGLILHYAIPTGLPVQPYASLHAGGARTEIAQATVREGGDSRVIDQSVEYTPWMRVAVGARRNVSESFSLYLTPGAGVAFTDADPTFDLSIMAGLRFNL